MDVVKALLRAAPAAATMATQKGQTALHAAACRGHAGAVEALLAGDADPLALDNDHSAPPLHCAAQEVRRWGAWSTRLKGLCGFASMLLAAHRAVTCLLALVCWQQVQCAALLPSSS